MVESIYISRVTCSTLAPSNNFSHASCIGIISHTIYEVRTFMGFTCCTMNPGPRAKPLSTLGTVLGIP